MARKKREPRRWIREVRGILALCLAGFGVVALAAFDPNARPADQASPVGPVGIWFGWAFFWAFGYAGYLFSLGLAFYGLSAFVRRSVLTGWSALVGLLLLLMSATGLLAQALDTPGEFSIPRGGMMGFWVAELLRRSVGQVGTLLVLLTIIPVAFLCLTQVSYAVLARSRTRTRERARASCRRRAGQAQARARRARARLAGDV